MGDFMNNSTWDEASLEKMINEYSTGLIKYCYSILGNYHDSQDAAQDAFPFSFPVFQWQALRRVLSFLQSWLQW